MRVGRERAMPTTETGVRAGRSAAALPDHETSYRRMRDMILFGELEPGRQVTIHGMREEIGAGMTPVREALRRLVAEGALEMLENRRVAVPRLAEAELDDIAHARLAIEPRLAEAAAAQMSAADVRAAQAWDAAVDEAIAVGDVGAYLASNYHFHFTFYRAARSDVLLRIATSLWLRIGPALRVCCGRFVASGAQDQHRDALAALARGDAAGVSKAIAEDIRQGVAFIKSVSP